MRQRDIAALAGVSDQTVSRVERGDLESISFANLRRLARVLEARVDLRLWTRAGDVERLAGANHAALAEALIAWFRAQGWEVRPEVSFSIYGERGLVDIVAWHAATRTLLLIEVKTEIVDVGETIGTFDRKRRLGDRIARQLGLESAVIGAALVVADTRTNHRRVQEHAATFSATLPDSGQRFRSFVARPSGPRAIAPPATAPPATAPPATAPPATAPLATAPPATAPRATAPLATAPRATAPLAALAFWPIRHPGSLMHLARGARRVRRPQTAARRAGGNVAGTRPASTRASTPPEHRPPAT